MTDVESQISIGGGSQPRSGLPRFLLVSNFEEEEKSRASQLMQKAADVLDEVLGTEETGGRGAYMWLTPKSAELVKPRKGLFLVFERFDETPDSFFVHAASRNADLHPDEKPAIIGPQVLIAWLRNEVPFELCPHATWCFAMRGLTICFSGLAAENGEQVETLRKSLKTMVYRMGGKVVRDFNERVTHLVCVSHLSDKYKAARETRTPVMSTKWIDVVHAASLVDPYVRATDAKFANLAFRCFEGVDMTLSQIPKREKAVLHKLIADNGGVVHHDLVLKRIKFVVAGAATGDKVKAAFHAQICVLKTAWLHDSSACGYMLDPDDYRLQMPNKVSTPTSAFNDRSLFDVSRVSCINDSALLGRAIEETLDSTSCSVDDFRSAERSDNVGVPLGGTRIFIYGSRQAPGLRKIVRAAGGVVCEDLNDDVTHVVAEVDGDGQQQQQGAVAEAVTRLLRGYPNANPTCVTSDWLKQCLEKNSHVDETNFLLHAPRTPVVSAAARSQARFPQLGSSSTREKAQVPASTRENPVALERPASAVPTRVSDGRRESQRADYDSTEASEEYSSDVVEALAQALQGKRVIVLDAPNEWLPPDSQPPAETLVLECGALLVPADCLDPADFVFVVVNTEKPVRPAVDLTRVRARELLTTLWLDDCTELRCLEPAHHFHRPLPPSVYDHGSVLAGCVVVPTGFNLAQREYIRWLSHVLGGVCLDMLSRRDNAEKGYLGCTHLIASQPKGAKYEKARSWDVCCVDVEWLVRSAFAGRRLPEAEFPVVALDEAECARRLEELDEFVLSQLRAAGCGGDVDVPAPADEAAAALDAPNDVVPESQYSQEPELESSEQTLLELDGDLTGVVAPDADAAAPRAASRRRAVGASADPFEDPGPPASDGGLNRDVPSRRNLPPSSSSSVSAVPPAAVAASRKRGPAGFDRSGDQLGPKPKRIVPVSQTWKEREERAREKFYPRPAQPASPATLDYARKRRRFEEERARVLREYERPDRPRDPTPLAGLVVLVLAGGGGDVDGGSEAVRRCLELAEDLGAVGSVHYDDAVTHVVVHNDSAQSATVSRARGDCKFLVSPAWLDLCREESTRVPEGLRPVGWCRSPAAAAAVFDLLNVSGGDLSPSLPVVPARPSVVLSGSTPPPLLPSSVPRPATSSAPGRVHVLYPNQGRADEDSEDPTLRNDLMRLAMIGDPSKSASRRTSAMSLDTASEHKENAASRSRDDMIAWKDPVAMETRKTIDAVVAAATQDPHRPLTMLRANASYFGTQAETEAMRDSEPLTQEPRRVFSCSKMDKNELDTIARIVRNLGGELIESRNLVDGITHFLTPGIARSEKALGLIAAGAWILHSTYIYDCDKNGKFLPEEGYEWGSPNLEAEAAKLNGPERDLAKAASFWRRRRQEGGGGCFSAFRVGVHVGEKSPAFRRILEAGGAALVDTRLPLKDPLDANLILVDGADLKSIDYDALAAKGVPAVLSSFTSLHLSSCGGSPLSASYVRDYAEALRQRRQKST